jgi:hypothetical protein
MRSCSTRPCHQEHAAVAVSPSLSLDSIPKTVHKTLIKFPSYEEAAMGKLLGGFIFAVVTGLVASFIYEIVRAKTNIEKYVGPETKASSRYCTFSHRSEKDITEGIIYAVGYRENVKLQIPPDLVVKFQPIDIVDVIL